MIKGNTVAHGVRASGKWTRAETERTESGEKSIVSSLGTDFHAGKFNPFFLFPRFSFTFFLSLFFYHGPTFPWALTSLRGRRAILRIHCYLCYIQESITISLTSSPSRNSILSVEANRRHNGTDYANKLWLDWSSALKFQHYLCVLFLILRFESANKSKQQN